VLENRCVALAWSRPMDEIDPKIYNWPHGGDGNVYEDTDDIWRHITTYEFVNHSTNEYISLLFNSDDEPVLHAKRQSKKFLAILKGYLLPAPHLSSASPSLYVEIPIKRYAIDFGLSPTDPDRGFWLEGIEYNTWYKLETPHEHYEVIATQSLHFASEYIKFYDALVYGIKGDINLPQQPLVKKKTKYHCNYNLQTLYEKSNHHFDLKFLKQHASEFYDLLEPHFSKNCEMMTNLFDFREKFSKPSSNLPAPSSNSSGSSSSGTISSSSGSPAVATSSPSSSSSTTKRKFQEISSKTEKEQELHEPKYSRVSSSLHAMDPIDLTLDDEEEEKEWEENVMSSKESSVSKTIHPSSSVDERINEKDPSFSSSSKPSQGFPSTSSAEVGENQRRRHRILDEDEDEEEEEIEFNENDFLPKPIKSPSPKGRGRPRKTDLSPEPTSLPKQDKGDSGDHGLFTSARKKQEPSSSSSGKVDEIRRRRILDDDDEEEEDEVDFNDDDFLPKPLPKRRGRPPQKYLSLAADVKPTRTPKTKRIIVKTMTKCSRRSASPNVPRSNSPLIAPHKDSGHHSPPIHSSKLSAEVSPSSISPSKSEGEKKAERLERLKGLVEEKKKEPNSAPSSLSSASSHPHLSSSSVPPSSSSLSSSSSSAQQTKDEDSKEFKRKSMKPDWQQKAERQQAERLALIQKKKDLPQDLRPIGIKLPSTVDLKKKVPKGAPSLGPRNLSRDIQTRPTGSSESKPRMVILSLFSCITSSHPFPPPSPSSLICETDTDSNCHIQQLWCSDDLNVSERRSSRDNRRWRQRIGNRQKRSSSSRQRRSRFLISLFISSRYSA
jgi:hypothetical protein